MIGSITRRGLAALVFAVLACCASPAPTKPFAPAPVPPLPPSLAQIRLVETECYFRCASYEMVVRADGAYAFTGRRNTASDGKTHEGRLPTEAWAKAQAAFEAAHFSTMPEKLVSQTAAHPVPCINDLPAAEFTRRDAKDAEKTVTFNQGCNVPEAAKLLADLRGIFGVADLLKTP